MCKEVYKPFVGKINNLSVLKETQRLLNLFQVPRGTEETTAIIHKRVGNCLSLLRDFGYYDEYFVLCLWYSKYTCNTMKPPVKS